MIHIIKILIISDIDDEILYISIEKVFNQNNFSIGRIENKLTFKRKIAIGYADRLQLIFELYKSFTQGTICIDNVFPKKLICKIYYFKQLILSLTLGLIISFIFAIYAGSFLTLFLQLGLPTALMFLIVGILTGNSQIKELLRKAIK